MPEAGSGGYHARRVRERRHLSDHAALVDLRRRGRALRRRPRGHIHQGQDVIAAEGTPLVSPVAGTVYWRAVQAGGAGHYLVIRGDDGRDYVFMHLVAGSELVDKGDTVRAGSQIGQVGTHRRRPRPHLHFEIWPDGWYAPKSQPIDPLPTSRPGRASQGRFTGMLFNGALGAGGRAELHRQLRRAAPGKAFQPQVDGVRPRAESQRALTRQATMGTPKADDGGDAYVRVEGDVQHPVPAVDFDVGHGCGGHVHHGRPAVRESPGRILGERSGLEGRAQGDAVGVAAERDRQRSAQERRPGDAQHRAAGRGADDRAVDQRAQSAADASPATIVFPTMPRRATRRPSWVFV